MSCNACAEFDAEVAIASPGQFKSVACKVRAAVNECLLRYDGFESDRELFGQPSFMALDLSAGPLPDVMRYHFTCPSCGESYALFIESYHGSGGSWSRSDDAA